MQIIKEMMRTNYQFLQKKSETNLAEKIVKSNDNKDPILCQHCKRSATNGIRCMGICVADNDY